MTKQEKITGELDRLFYEAMRLSPFQNTNVLFATNRSRANHKAKIYTEKAIYLLHSQGVVLKVEGKLPIPGITSAGNISLADVETIGKAFQQAYLGYVEVEPLIEGQ